MLLDAKNVSKAFGSFLAVSGADLAVDEHEIIGLIGPNGAGKSTFFNCLAGETLPTTGRIVFNGEDVTRAGPAVHARAGIGRTFQVPITFEDMTVLENVMVGAFLRHPHRNDARDHARRIVELTGLQPEQRARSLGTPGRKRLEIARVLATEPRLLLLDESLAGLTPDRIAGGDRAGAAHPRHGHHHRHRRAHHGSDHDADQARAWSSTKAMSSPAARRNPWSGRTR